MQGFGGVVSGQRSTRGAQESGLKGMCQGCSIPLQPTLPGADGADPGGSERSVPNGEQAQAREARSGDTKRGLTQV